MSVATSIPEAAVPSAATHDPLNPSAVLFDRVALVLSIVVLLSSIGAVALQTIHTLQWYNTPFSGVMWMDGLMVDDSQPLNGNWNGLKVGLRPNDQLLSLTDAAGNTTRFAVQIAAMDGMAAMGTATSIAADTQLEDVLRGLSRGQIVQLTIARSGSAKVYDAACPIFTATGQQCTYSVELAQLPLIDFLWHFGVSFVVGLIFLVIGVLVLLRHSNSFSGRWLVGGASLSAVLIIGHFDMMSSHQGHLQWIISACGLSGALFGLAITFPYRASALYRFAWLRFSPIGLSLLSTLICLLMLTSPNPALSSAAEPLAAVVALFGGFVLLANLVARRIYSPSPLNREQAGLALIGLLVATAPLLLWVAGSLLSQLFSSNLLSFPVPYVLPPLVIFPMSVTYSLFRNRLMDSDRVLSEGLIYSVLGLGLVIGYSLLTFALYLVTSGVVTWNSPIPVALTIFLMAVVFSPLRRALENVVDKTFYRHKHMYENRLETFARKLTQMVEIRDAVGEIQTQMLDTLAPGYVYVFVRNQASGEYEALSANETRNETDIRFSPGSALLTYLGANNTLYLLPDQPLPTELAPERSRLAVLNAPVIARMQSSSRLNGFLAIGPRQDRTRYTFEDLRFIQGLAEQAALAVERSQVILEAQRNERELRVLSQVSAALNITMDLDTLLEFIYTQASKIIRTTNFYIAMRTSNDNEMQMVFFLEKDDRLITQEGRRWHMGQDLFSEVARIQQPLVVPNCVDEVRRRNFSLIPENTALRAWAGVPLNAGTGNALGVAAVASEDPLMTFTEDQVRIFANIVDLAAAALDKSRLFRETEERARQLAVLNGISGQLASEFENVDALLDLITHSAVDILSAEAGSLLLRNENAGDLIFTMAIGGAGQNLIGTTVPSGAGIAGRVVETGQPVIVNDTSSDSSWYGDVQNTTVREFRTNAILAVPLIARGGVIGVLEVINKKNGSRFAPSEVDLLTTFASQAAIAIENARLFQMTDEQLEARVNQLDNMQRIDQELNRTLDLQGVINLTLDNALRESHADAGALAIVRHEPRHGFEVAGSLNYAPGTFTPGEIYPIDMGVLGRVYRTGQSSLVTNLEDDSDYIETMAGAVAQIAVPMATVGKGVTAVLLLESRQPGTFTLVSMSFITALAEHANTAITNAQLFEELQQANAARSDFVRFVAHELGNPTTSIKGYVEAILAGMTGAVSDQQKGFLDIVQRNVVRMQQIIGDLRDVTALETGRLAVNLQPASFNNVVVETLRPQQRAISNKQQTLIVDVPDGLPLIMGDGNRLIQVLTNFVSNANKYTPEGGIIRVKAEVTASGTEGTGQFIHCQVIDTGYGMSDEDVKQLSTPYFRSENPLAREQPGTGLGMTITYALIEAHGGRIWVESELGEGTTFHFTVPVAVESVSAASR